MKIRKLLLLVSLSAAWACASAQIYTEPRFITTDYNTNGETFYVYFDATQGSGGMAGATACYAHTGVITTASTSDSDWKHAPTWLDNSAKYQMESVSTNLWRLEITGGIAAYYGLDEGEAATKLAFVFRNADGTAEGKTEDGADIMYELYEPGLNVVITAPEDGTIYSLGEQISIKGESSAEATLSLLVNGQETTAQGKTISTTASFDSETSVEIILRAESGEETAADTISVFVAGETVYQKMPEGMVEGINYDAETKTVGLAFRAPLSNSAYILGDFNDWQLSSDYHMYCDTTLDGSGNVVNKVFWREFTIADPLKKYAFQYKVDDVQLSDPYAEVVLDGSNDRYITELLDPTLPAYPEDGDDMVSVLTLEDSDPYQWSEATTNFEIPAKTDLIIYELHIRDFCTDERTGQGSLDCVSEKLDYLQELGVNAIELMPVNEFDGNDSWGYNPSHYFAYDKAYGTMNEYKAFIDECHKRGMAVIIDMVINHATGWNSFAKLYWDGDATAANNPWFNRVARHPYNVYHDFNHEYEGTRQFFKRVLKYWIEEYKVDGYRMDLTKGLTQTDYGSSGEKGNWDSYDASRIAILKDYYSAVKEAREDAIFILEHLSQNAEETELSNAGMLPWRNMNNAYSQAAMGYASDSKFTDAATSGGMFANGWVGYAESHDEERNFYKVLAYGDGDLQENEAARLARVPLMMAFAHFIPGPKMLWQFGELGYDYSIGYCTDGTIDADACRTGRKPSPFNLGWETDEGRMAAYEGASKIISLRTQHPEYFRSSCVTTANCQSTSWRDDQPRTIRVSYTDEANPDNSIEMIIVGNFKAADDMTTTLTFPKAGTWYEYLSGEEISVGRLSRTLQIPAGEVKIYTDRALSTAIEETEAAAESAVKVYPTVASDYIYIDSADDIESVTVYNLEGRTVASGSSFELPVSQLSEGNYIVRVQTASGSSVHKIIKD